MMLVNYFFLNNNNNSKVDDLDKENSILFLLL